MLGVADIGPGPPARNEVRGVTPRLLAMEGEYLEIRAKTPAPKPLAALYAPTSLLPEGRAHTSATQTRPEPLFSVGHCNRALGGGSPDNPWYRVEGCGLPAHLVYWGQDSGGAATASRIAVARWVAEAVIAGGTAGGLYLLIRGGSTPPTHRRS